MKLFGRTLAILAISAAALFTPSGLALAHHGAAAFDTDKMVTVKGAVTELVYMNPHVQVYWETKNEQGVSEKWQGELTAPNKLTRAGWNKNTLKPGDQITAAEIPTRIIRIRCGFASLLVRRETPYRSLKTRRSNGANADPC